MIGGAVRASTIDGLILGFEQTCGYYEQDQGCALDYWESAQGGLEPFYYPALDFVLSGEFESWCSNRPRSLQCI